MEAGRRQSVVVLLLALVLGGPRAGMADQAILGAKLLVKDPTGDPGRRRLVVRGREERGGPATLVGDPTSAGASLRVLANGATNSDQSFDLPAAGWLVIGGVGFRFSNARVGGAVRRVVLKRTAGGRFVLTVSARGSLDVVPPNPGDDGAAVLTIPGGDRYCVSLGGLAGGRERRDDARTWYVQRATAALCPSPPTTTSTTATTLSTTTTETSTTTHTSTTTVTTSSSTTTLTTATTSTTTTTTTTTLTTTTVTTTTVTTTTPTTTSTTTTTATSTTTLPIIVKELNLLYVHGLKSCPDDRMNAQNSLDELEGAVNAALPARIAAYQVAHPGTVVVTHSARANLYTATPSGFHPSDSPDPLNMDDWEVGDPGCSTTQQGDKCTTAYEWRYRLAQEIQRLFPAPAKNVVLIGHSAGARAAMEVTANVGTGGVGATNWGVQDRIAGVVTIHGMLDAIGGSKYDVVGISSFESSCKLGDAIVGFGESCAPGNGWCEYAGRVGGFAASDWVAQNKHALMLTSWGSCSPSAWSGRSDGSLPYDAQASPWAIGLDMTPAPGETWREAHGQRYGAFCHSAITNPSNASHAAARDAARNRILDWLFVAAPRVAASGTNVTSGSIPYLGFSSTFTMGSSCPAGQSDDTLTAGTAGPGIDVVGVCRHPGFFDGDDHAIASGEFSVTNGSTCNGTYRWQQAHDASNNHAASFWWKTRSLGATGADLLAGLPAS